MVNLIFKRFNIIKKLIKGKSVLDLGCVAHDFARESNNNWLHKNIVKYAKSVLGVDWNSDDVKKLQNKGYNMISGNVESINLGEQFDVIVAGELLEHLSNQGLFLENMKKHLKKNGRLIITTPNSLFVNDSLSVFCLGDVRLNCDHMCTHTERTLKQLIIRHGLFVDQFYFVNEGSNDEWQYFGFYKFKRLILNYLLTLYSNFWVILRPNYAATLMVVCKK